MILNLLNLYVKFQASCTKFISACGPLRQISTQCKMLRGRHFAITYRKKLILRYFALNGNRPECSSLLRRGFSHTIDTRPEGTLLCVLAWEKRPKFFTCYAILESTLCLCLSYEKLLCALQDGVFLRQHS